MQILERLQNNKGTISSQLGKNLAQEVLNGNNEILIEAISLLTYKENEIEQKIVRSGAAKIVEKVAEKNHTLVSPHLNKIIPALSVPEPQTRWMAIRTIGYCAQDNPEKAHEALDYAKKFLDQNEGVCLSGATSLYLGDLGATSEKYAKESLQILENFIKKASENEVDWVLEALIKIYDSVIDKDKKRIKKMSQKHINAPKKSTKKRVEVILEK